MNSDLKNDKKTLSYHKNHLNEQMDECIELYSRELCQEITNPDILTFICTLQLLSRVFYFLIGAGGKPHKFTPVPEVYMIPCGFFSLVKNCEID